MPSTARMNPALATRLPSSAATTPIAAAEIASGVPPMALLCLDKIRKEEQLHNGDRILSFVTEVSKFMQAGYLMRYFSKP